MELKTSGRHMSLQCKLQTKKSNTKLKSAPGHSQCKLNHTFSPGAAKEIVSLQVKTGGHYQNQVGRQAGLVGFLNSLRQWWSLALYEIYGSSFTSVGGDCL